MAVMSIPGPTEVLIESLRASVRLLVSPLGGCFKCKDDH